MPVTLRENMTILFQGDSITDCGRNNAAPPLGRGYAYLVSSWLSATYPELCLQFVNRGISGNRTRDLLDRWQVDCLDVKPDLLSILIGVNNTWRRFDCNDPTSAEQFYEEYHALCTSVRRNLDCDLALCEPFLVSVPQNFAAWREDLNPKIHITRELAREFGALLVPFDGVFAAASARAEPAYWAEDGVHPTAAGHALLARAWLEHVTGLRV